MFHVEDISSFVGGTCFVVKQAFTEHECKELILNEYYKAGTHYPTSYRNNSRHVKDDKNLANKLISKIIQYIPKEIIDEKGKWEFNQINSRIRFCRYLKDQYFNKHLDGVYHKSNVIQSKLTFMIYLNGKENFKGGETLFFPSKQSDEITYKFLPNRGDLIIFDHNIWHSGSTLLSGEKYILRSDLLYELKSSNDKILKNNHLGYIWNIIVLNNKIYSCSRDCTIKTWNFNLNLIDSVSASSFSTLVLLAMSNHCLISGSRDTSLIFWNIIDEKLFFDKKLENCHDGAILDLVKVNDSLFLSSSADGNVKIWDSSNYKEICVFSVHNDWIWQVKVLQFNVHFIVCTISEDFYVKIWKIIENSSFDILSSECLSEPCTSCYFEENNMILLCGTNSGMIHVFEIDEYWKLTKIQTWKAHNGKITTLLVDIKSNGDLILYSGSEDMSICIWKLNEEKLMETYYHKNFVTTLAWADSRLVSASYDGTLKTWEKI